MKVPLSWLGEFVEAGVEPARLAEDLTLAGLAVDAVERHGSEVVLDIDVTTNRVDCMNVYGIAREVSVLYGLALKPLDLDFAESGPPAGQALEVRIEAPELCPRFCARVLDVRMGPAPSWIRDRLELVGVRPINNVVDLTNYVMMEMGHPSHAFDLAKLPGGRLIIRWCQPGEALKTLDGVDRSLETRIGVVAGAEGPLALAGIMGGAMSEVCDETRSVALEAAYWEPLAIRRGARALGMHSEASHRFERGADPEGPVLATARLAHLLGKIGAGTTRPGLIDRSASPRPRRSALLRPSRLSAVLGVEIPEPRALAILRGLGFGVGPRAGEGFAVAIPTWRGDVAREADLIEEIARHYGLDKIPATLPPSRGVEGLRPHQVRERAIRESLVGAGLTEVVSYAFVAGASAALDPAPRLALANPLSAEQDVLRSSLVVPGLLTNLRVNLNQGRRDVRIFELGRVFGPGPEDRREERRLGLLLAGAAHPPHWSEKRRAADIFDAKGLLEALAERLEVGLFRFEGAGAPGFLHPGRSAVVFHGRLGIGWLGSLHPDVAAAWELRDETLVAEIGLEALFAQPAAAVRFRALPRFPEVTRDLSVVCDADLPAAELVARVRAAGGELLREVTLADRYTGPSVPPGKLSLTLALRYQHPERTLTGGEVQASLAAIEETLRRVGAEIRGE